MSKHFLVALMVLAFAGAAQAQRSQGYVFAVPVWIPHSGFTFWQGSYVHVGGGGEAALGSLFTLGGEIGALIALENNRRSAAVFSVNPYLHPLRTGKVDPFVTGGFSLLAGSGAAAMVNLGGGLNYWFAPRFGLRLEFRDHAWSPESGSSIHFLGVRFGLSFRSNKK